MTTKKPKKKLEDPMKKSRELEEAELAGLRIDIEDEQKKKDSISWSNAELEKNVRSMEMNVIQLESGNLEADDSEIKLKYDNQRQLNIQLAEQKRWLEHELEQIKLKIQNEKMNPLPDPFALDWDALSETEMKRLVGQLEKTRNDLRSDLREMEWRLDKEGREYHHYEDFCKLYRVEILNLNRTLDALMRSGMLPSNLQFPISASSSATNSYPGTGAQTPGSPRKGSSMSPPIQRRMKKDYYPTSPTRRRPGDLGSPTKSPTKNMGPVRKTAGVRNLPKLEKRNGKADRKSGSRRKGGNVEASEAIKTDLKPVPLAPLSGKRSSERPPTELEAVAEAAKEE